MTTTTKTTKPLIQQTTKSLIWVGRRPAHENHAAAVAEIRRRFAKTTRPNSIAKLGAFLAKYDSGEAVAHEVPDFN